jgi:hypothetical protein
LAAAWRVFLFLPAGLMRLRAPVAQSTDVSLIGAGVTAIAGAVACLILLPLALGMIGRSEDHIANANRRREKRERVLAHLDGIAVPRWALSLTGIAAIFTVLAIFGSQSKTAQALLAVHAQGLVFLATTVLAGVAGVIVTRDWRAFFSCSIPPVLAAIWCVPVAVGSAVALNIPGAGVLSEAPIQDLLCVNASLSAGVCCLIAARMAAFRRQNDLPNAAFARTAREVAIPIFASAIVTALILFPLGLGLLPLVCAAAAVVLTPAFTVLAELTFPTLRTVDELYGKRKFDPS